MKKALFTVALGMSLTGCAGYSNWSPLQQVKGSDGKMYTWIAPLPATADGSQGIAGRSASVHTYYGTANGHSFTITSFK